MKRVLISGGGTGGHIFPALAIADAIKKIDPLCEILFVGAEGKMEMEKVPSAGYKILGLPVRGFQRKFTLQNVTVLSVFMQAQQLLEMQAKNLWMNGKSSLQLHLK